MFSPPTQAYHRVYQHDSALAVRLHGRSAFWTNSVKMRPMEWKSKDKSKNPGMDKNLKVGRIGCIF